MLQRCENELHQTVETCVIETASNKLLVFLLYSKPAEAVMIKQVGYSWRVQPLQ